MILYSKATCAPCKSVKYLLDKLGADYEVRDVSNPDYFEEAIKYAIAVPVLVKGDQVVIGANLPAIRELATSAS